ncbi:MAG: U32 family peptidase [Prolixibacteraceae bacterium]|jgi:putative protease|nr:U32 family peptidase [Prolixibacteraceae bacterium]
MSKGQAFQPELLLPVGNTEAFYAALKGGADAIFLGLRNFNARNRASNFTPWQLSAIVKEAHQHKVKVYVTLNTVIRNLEINTLIDTLFILSQIKPDAVIVQDWGVVYLIRKFFPQLTIHASTQMANHNSIGANYSKKMGIERVVMARELTKPELEKIAKKSQVELELFIHGALCYSFSGMCLFSSFLGGASANRGQCTQPCRRNYTQSESENYFFSLKDNQLIEHLPFLEQLKIDSFKVEGRIKSAEYVYQVATAYRTALDYPEKREEAQLQLKTDLGRDKTDYFYGNKIKDAITQASNTGLFLGLVSNLEDKSIQFTSKIGLPESCRLRFRSKENDQQVVLKVNEMIRDENNYTFESNNQSIQIGDEVYLAGLRMKFPTKLNTNGIDLHERCPMNKQKSIKAKISHRLQKGKTEIYLRIDSLAWMRKIRIEDYDAVLLQLSKSELAEFNPKLPFIQKNKNKIHVELPRFIPEGDLEFYRNTIQRIYSAGLTHFFLSHLSQKDFLPRGAQFSTNENVYAFNDAAVQLLKEEGARKHIYPLENDIVNMSKGTDHNGIVPVYFFPYLFYSRMPVQANKDEYFVDKMGEKFRKIVKDGITIVLPEHPVSLTQYKSKLERYGYQRFLIDMSTTAPSKNTPRTIVRKFKASEQIQPASNFNFKRELK